MRLMAVLLLALSAPVLAAGWPHWGNDAGGARHAAGTEITPANVADLEIAWRYATGDRGQDARDRRHTFEATPVLWEGRLYFTTAYGDLHVVDARTGSGLWTFAAGTRRDVGYGEVASRGVSLWHAQSGDEHCDHRVLWGTIGGVALAVDARSGKPCEDFGEAGRLDLLAAVEGDYGRYTVTSPPVIAGDQAIFGSAIGDNWGIEVERGIVRAIDVRSGAERWRFDPIPRSEDEPNWVTWTPEATGRYGGANAWPPLSYDASLGLVFVPTSSPSPDFFGGTRPGDNRYANSLVALRAEDGTVAWHQQLVHHDLWDYDLPAQPVLTNLKRDGREYPVVLQATKMGLVFTFHRATGEPFWPIEERPVPGSAAEGEWVSPTQPFPTRPEPLISQRRLTADDAWGMLWFDQQDCAQQIEAAHSEGMYTPPTVQGTLMSPSWAGGLNWGGLAIAEDRQMAVAFVMTLPGIIRLIERDTGDLRAIAGDGPDGEYNWMHGTPYYMYRQPLMSPLGVPCVAPPWGELVGVDLSDGSIRWRTPVGSPADLVPVWLPRTAWGVPGIGGPMTTASGLVFVGAAAEHRFRAYATETGELLWEGALPFGGQANPMSYTLDGRQYVVIAAGGHTGPGLAKGDVLVAFALPED